LMLNACKNIFQVMSICILKYIFYVEFVTKEKK
jgi:hypothetical protein